MGLFDEIRRQVQEALDEARGEAPAPKPRRERPPRRDAQAEARKRAAAAAPAQPRAPRAPRPVVRPVITAPSLDAETDAGSVRALLRDRARLRQAIVLKEVLGPPVSMRRGLPHQR